MSIPGGLQIIEHVPTNKTLQDVQTEFQERRKREEIEKLHRKNSEKKFYKEIHVTLSNLDSLIRDVVMEKLTPEICQTVINRFSSSVFHVPELDFHSCKPVFSQKTKYLHTDKITIEDFMNHLKYRSTSFVINIPDHPLHETKIEVYRVYDPIYKYDSVYAEVRIYADKKYKESSCSVQ